jgi:NAD-dependent SIR2 family protein deacetylase
MNTPLHNESKNPVEKCSSILKGTKGLLVVTGAGISAESGLPTYRGPGGDYEKNPELLNILSEEGWDDNPCRLWRYLDAFRVSAAQAKPNAAHYILAQWEQEQRFEKFLIATQNIDRLHQVAGSKRVTELHGSAWQMACPKSDDYGDDPLFSKDARAFMSSTNREDILKRWSQENNQTIWENRDVPFRSIPPYTDPTVRPNILLFNQGYGNRLLWVDDFIKNKPDVILIIGCSGGVSILDRLVRSCREINPDCAIININAHADPITMPHLHVPMLATSALHAINDMLIESDL